MKTNKKIIKEDMNLAKELGREIGAPVAAGIATKNLTKAIAGKTAKVVPGVGTALSVKDAYDRWQRGDRTGAVISTLAAAGWAIPGIGWIPGLAADAVNIGRDIKAGDYDEVGQMIKDKMTKENTQSVSTKMAELKNKLAQLDEANPLTTLRKIPGLAKKPGDIVPGMKPAPRPGPTTIDMGKAVEVPKTTPKLAAPAANTPKLAAPAANTPKLAAPAANAAKAGNAASRGKAAAAAGAAAAGAIGLSQLGKDDDSASASGKSSLTPEEWAELHELAKYLRPFNESDKNVNNLLSIYDTLPKEDQSAEQGTEIDGPLPAQAAQGSTPAQAAQGSTPAQAAQGSAPKISPGSAPKISPGSISDDFASIDKPQQTPPQAFSYDGERTTQSSASASGKAATTPDELARMKDLAGVPKGATNYRDSVSGNVKGLDTYAARKTPEWQQIRQSVKNANPRFADQIADMQYKAAVLKGTVTPPKGTQVSRDGAPTATPAAAPERPRADW